LKGLAGQLPPLPQQSNNAWLCYYLTQACNRLWTHLTPTHSDFWSWVVNPPLSVLRDPVQQDVLKALDTGTAIALVRHQRRVAETRIPASVE
jgi:hypothetical protein